MVVTRVEDQKEVVARRWGTCEASESWGRASSEGAGEAEVPGSNDYMWSPPEQMLSHWPWALQQPQQRWQRPAP